MKFWSIEELKAELKLYNVRAIAPIIGLHEQTIYSFITKKGKTINFETYKKLVIFFEGKRSEGLSDGQ